MTRILFVCLGNICRSPMAEYIMKDLAARAGLGAEFEIDSAAISSEEEGNPVYPPARAILQRHGVACGDHRARRMTAADYDRFDLLIGMEQRHLQAMRNRCGGDPQNKMHLLLDYTGHPGTIDDPWYTGDFQSAWCDIHAGCTALLHTLTEGQP